MTRDERRTTKDEEKMSDRPNLIFIMPDQLRHDFLGCYGADFIETPNIDRLCEGGIRYDRAYSPSPACVPARASLLTGMNAVKTGVLGNGYWLRPDLAECGVRTWPEILSEACYTTAAIGKMHFYPWDERQGFQYRVIAEDKRWIHIRDDYYRHLRQHGLTKLNGKEHAGYFENKGATVSPIPWEHSVDHFVGEETCRYLRNYGGEQPFAMMVGFPGPHCPYDPCPEYLERVDPDQIPPAIPEVDGLTPKLRETNIRGNLGEWNGVDYTEFTDAHKRKIRAHYAALVMQIDQEVGRILDTLEAEGLRENTVVVFASDHGDYLGDHGLIGKGSFYEASTHIPLIVNLPKRETATASDDLVTLTDVTATLLHLAGCPLPEYMDSQPLRGIGHEDEDRPARNAIFGMNQSGWMLYDGTWKLSKYASGESTLFNLEDDPGEIRNRIDDPACSERVKAMDTRLTSEVMRSVAFANREKTVDLPNTLWSNPRYGMEGQQRQYPTEV